MTDTITFSEYTVGTVNPVYTFNDNTVDVLGEIVEDGAQPASPAAAANTSYIGPVFIDFTNPVTHVDFNAGYFDDLQSTTVTFIGPGGAILQSSLNSQYGIVPYSFDNAGGISAINVVNTGYDASGFSVDTIDFSGAVAAPDIINIFTITPDDTIVTPDDPIYTFTVTRTGDLSGAASVGYAVTGTGVNPLVAADLPNGTYPVGQLSFAAGQASQTVTVDVLGGYTPSNPVTFAVTLLAPSAGATVGSISEAAGTTLPPPTVSNTLAGQQTTDTLAISPFTGVTVADINIGETETLTVTLSAAANGALTNLGTGTYDASTGIYTDIGSAADVTTALDGLAFVPTSGQVAKGQTVTTGFTIGVVDSDNAFTSDRITTVVATSGSTVLPTITGTLAAQAATDAATISPFGAVVVTDTAPGATETLTVSLSAAANGTVSNLGGGTYDNIAGVYTVGGTAAAVTTALEGLQFTPTDHQVAPGQAVTTGFTIDDTNSVGASVTDAVTSVVATAAVVPGFAAFDTTTAQALPSATVAYTGPVSGLTDQYINVTTDNIAVSTSSGNWFIHSGSGEDAIAVQSGTNVLDGGTGSNFLSGGTGTDTFFVDDRSPASNIWSTVNNFHAGDAATIWGVTPQDHMLSWADNQGAAGFTGLTAQFTAPGSPTASLTLAGYSSADLSNGRLDMSYGFDPASNSSYMYIQANS